MKSRWLAALWLLLLLSPLARGATIPPATESTGASPELLPDPLGPVPPDEPRNEAYAHGHYALFFLGSAWSLAVLLGIVWSGFGARLQRAAERITQRPHLGVAVYAVLLSLVYAAATFPIDVYSGFVREKRYGFLNQGFGAWLGDQGKALLVGIAIQALFLPFLYLLIRRRGRAWWAPGAALTLGFVVLVQAIFPVFIAPLFNTFRPLGDDALRSQILDLAHTQGIPADEVYEVDASRQSEHNNAYVAGLLGTQRIVLYDTLLRRFAPREIRFIMGHEMGHYVLHHIWKSIAFSSVFIVAGLLIIDRLARRIIRTHPSCGIRAIEDPASLPLLLLLASGLLLLARPIISSYSQAQEGAADRFGLEAVRDPEAAASSFLKFGRFDLSEHDVHPLIEKILLTHPSVAHRIQSVQEWTKAHPGAAHGPQPPPAEEKKGRH